MTLARLLASVAGVGLLSAIAVGACSTEPSFVNDTASAGPATGGSGGDGTGGSGASAAGGGSVGECVIPADCPGVENECSTRTCTGGVCGMDLARAGTPIGQQVSGDCKSNSCDGKGEVVVANDDADVPFDANDCTEDKCTAGVPSHPEKPMGTPCGVDGMLTCNATGSCTGCTDAAQCGANADCVQQGCKDLTCYQIFTPDGGGTVAGQIAEDCKKIVCNGAGGTKVIEDANDPKPDASLCTSDFCSGGVPSYQSIPPQDDGNACTDDICNPMTGATDHTAKPGGTSCGACLACEGTTCKFQCSGCDSCQGGQCASTCQSCETCQGGQCVSTCGNCTSCIDNQCQGGCAPCEACNGGQCQNTCQPCQQCNGGVCTGGCGPCQQCSGGSCVNLCGPCQACQNNQCVNTCTGCQTCQGGACMDNSANCPGCHACQGGQCVDQCTAPCHDCINNTCMNTCLGPCSECLGGDICNDDPCCFNPCCGDPCCNPQGSGQLPPVPICP